MSTPATGKKHHQQCIVEREKIQIEYILKQYEKSWPAWPKRKIDEKDPVYMNRPANLAREVCFPAC